MINKINSTQNFNGITILKTKKPILLNFLDDVNTRSWNKSKTAQFKYMQTATSTPKNGYFEGVLLTGKDIKADLFQIQKNGKEKIINNKNELFNLTEFKKIKNFMKNLYEKFTH